MRRPGLLPIVIVLGIVTAATLLRTAETLSEPRIDGPNVERSKAVVREFYAGLNDAIRNDDPAALARVASSDLVVFRSDAVTAPGQAGLLAQIAPLHAAYPDLRAVVDDLIADGDLVLARIRLVGAEGMGVRGVPVAAGPSWGFTDVLRINAGRVVEYTGIVTDLTAPHRLFRETYQAGSAESAQVGMARLTLDAGMGFSSLVSPGPTVYTVEAGQLSFHALSFPSIKRAAAAGTPAASEQVFRRTVNLLGPGDQVTIPAGVAHFFHATDDGPAIVLAMSLMSPSALGKLGFDNEVLTPDWPLEMQIYFADTRSHPSSAWPSGVVSQPLTSSIFVPLPPSPFEIVTWRVTLAPDAFVGGREPGGQQLVAVQAGTALLVTTSEEHDRTMTVLESGSTAILKTDAGASIRNAGDTPLVLLVLSFASSDGPATLTLPSMEGGQSCFVDDTRCGYHP